MIIYDYKIFARTKQQKINIKVINAVQNFDANFYDGEKEDLLQMFRVLFVLVYFLFGGVCSFQVFR